MNTLNNAELEHINTIFSNNGWINKKYINNEYIYIKNNEYDEFRINFEDNLINIISPMPNSSFLYKKTFNNSINICNYLDQHIRNYNEKIKNHINNL